ncbi:nuclease-related domain-containing protein [Ornithinibacillus californiensis]|uniref:nuclease-related domain-containing protein n=1 Tax=Ornithinibacillus californiensis TaxID=161536 RepID=UPI00064DD34D|nr:nuclease-related domain-containing protein [Ornithinibacillus californiensis]
MSSKVQLFRTKPYIILCYEALFRQLKPQYRKNQILLNEYYNHQAGFQGEKYSDYTVSIFPHKDAYIYQGIRLKNGPYFFQIDTLIVAKTFILILEIKHWKSEIEYDSNTHQTTQNSDDKRKAFRSPILQANNQKMQLTSWLQKRHFPNLPIETIAILSNPATILTYKGESEEFHHKFIHLDHLPAILEQHYANYTRPYLDHGSMNKLNNALLKNHTPHKPDLIKQFGITNDHLIKGIECNDCSYSPLIYKKRKWYCSNCDKFSETAHVQKILDYFLLINPMITNKACRELLLVESPRVVYRLLNSMNLRYTGNNSARKYFAPRLDEYPQDYTLPSKSKSVFSSLF